MKMFTVCKLIILFILLLQPTLLTSASGEAVIIFSNCDLSNTLFMNRLMVQRIFTKKDTRWSNGQVINVFIKPMDSIEHRDFVNNVLNMTLYRYQKSLETYTYTARAIPITEVSDDYKMLAAIHTHSGAIGYINFELVSSEKIIKIVE